MYRILINAYAVCPGMGSEPGMGWNWCVNLAKHCELHIITEGEFREEIEKVVAALPQKENMHFYYNPVTDDIRRMCWNQGDWRFYKYYKEWQWKTYQIAKEICENTHIDVLHQLNMIGFREPGYLWKLSKEKNIPFVWGPIGGLKQFPLNYSKDGGFKSYLMLRLKNFLNVLQIKYSGRVDKALSQASILISSIPDSYNALHKYKTIDSIVIPETGCFNGEIKEPSYNRFCDGVLNIIWVGKFDYRKRLDIAIKTIAEAKNKNIYLHIYGKGTSEQNKKYKELANGLDIQDNILWHGNRPNDEIKQQMSKQDLFLFTSVNEDTSTVVLEAISSNLPVVCFDTCGMSKVINETVGIKIPLTNPKQSIKDFAKAINFLNENREELKRMSENCMMRKEELSWDNKIKQMVELYEKVVVGV